MSPSFHSENVEASKRCINALKNSAQDILLEINGKIPLSVAVFLLCVFFRHFSFKEVKSWSLLKLDCHNGFALIFI